MQRQLVGAIKFLPVALIALTFSGPARGQEGIVEVATEGLVTFRELLQASGYEAFGFASYEQTEATTVGEPIPISFVRLDELRQFGSDTDPRSLLHDVRRLLVPVLFEGRPVSTMTLVEVTPGTWKVAEFGGPLQRIVAAAVAHPAISKTVVHVAALHLYFLGFEREDDLFLIPFSNDPELGLVTGEPRPAREVFAGLQSKAAALGDGLG